MVITGVIVAGLGVAGCGSSSTSNGEINKSSDQILKDAQQATAAQPSVHVKGKISSTGTAIQLDLVAAMGNGGGTIGENGANLQVVLHQPNFYVMADEASWTKLTNSRATAQLLAGRWLQTTAANKNFTELGRLVDITKLVDALKPSGALSTGKLTTFNGVSVVPVIDSRSSGNRTVFVAATGKPVIEGVDGGGDHSGSLTFDQYGKGRVPGVPAGAVSLDKLQQAGG
ncbi:MAG: hypothetical protein M3063_04915 [Actinomycetota bacterium]|nr:hypothetical protein [Actinomycetota bacterium]